jgi:hypothetical protein
MRNVLIGGDGLMARRIVITFVQAETLRRFGTRPWALDHDGLEGSSRQLAVVCVGASHGGPEQASSCVHDQVPLYPSLPRSVGLRPTRSPPSRAFPMVVSAACHFP